MSATILYLNTVSGDLIHRMQFAGIRRYADVRGWEVVAVPRSESRSEDLPALLAVHSPVAGCVVEAFEDEIPLFAKPLRRRSCRLLPPAVRIPRRTRRLCGDRSITCHLAAGRFPCRSSSSAPLPGGDAPPTRIPMPMNVWKGWNESCWRLADGVCYGAVSHDESADGFNLWTEADGRQHADIPFRPATNPITLAPGETLAAPRPMGAIIVLEP